MKTKIKLFAALAVIGLSVLSARANKVAVGVFNIDTLTNAAGENFVSNTAPIFNTNGASLLVPQNSDALFWPSVTTISGLGTSNVVYGFNTTPDGTNWTTTLPITLTVPAGSGAGTNSTGMVFISRTNFTGALRWRLDSVSTSGGLTNLLIRPLRVSWWE